MLIRLSTGSSQTIDFIWQYLTAVYGTTTITPEYQGTKFYHPIIVTITNRVEIQRLTSQALTFCQLHSLIFCRYFCFVTECQDPKACTILLRGPSKDILNEVSMRFSYSYCNVNKKSNKTCVYKKTKQRHVKVLFSRGFRVFMTLAFIEEYDFFFFFTITNWGLHPVGSCNSCVEWSVGDAVQVLSLLFNISALFAVEFDHGVAIVIMRRGELGQRVLSLHIILLDVSENKNNVGARGGMDCITSPTPLNHVVCGFAQVERNLHDAMNVTRNVMLDPRLVPGGGATEMALAHVGIKLFNPILTEVSPVPATLSYIVCVNPFTPDSAKSKTGKFNQITN